MIVERSVSQLIVNQRLVVKMKNNKLRKFLRRLLNNHNKNNLNKTSLSNSLRNYRLINAILINNLIRQ